LLRRLQRYCNIASAPPAALSPCAVGVLSRLQRDLSPQQRLTSLVLRLRGLW
jgi:hypothetical protein